MKSAGNEGVIQSRLQVLHVHVFLVAPLGARLKGLIALAFQGFFIMVCVAIYAVLVASVAVAGNLHSALWSVAAYTVILCFSLFKTGSLSKSIFNAH